MENDMKKRKITMGVPLIPHKSCVTAGGLMFTAENNELERKISFVVNWSRFLEWKETIQYSGNIQFNCIHITSLEMNKQNVKRLSFKLMINDSLPVDINNVPIENNSVYLEEVTDIFVPIFVLKNKKNNNLEHMFVLYSQRNMMTGELRLVPFYQCRSDTTNDKLQEMNKALNTNYTSLYQNEQPIKIFEGCPFERHLYIKKESRTIKDLVEMNSEVYDRDDSELIANKFYLVSQNDLNDISEASRSNVLKLLMKQL